MKSNNKFAIITFLVKNDSYLAGALLLAHSLKKQKVLADIICLITNEISGTAVAALNEAYDFVVEIDNIYLKITKEQNRQHINHVFNRIHALRFGSDGDLGFSYEKVIIMDSDILAVKYYQQLFLLPTPAGILNEKKEHFLGDTDNHPNIQNGIWKWHSIYQNIPHGFEIPKRITDRVVYDNNNFGINTALMVLKPSMIEYDEINNELKDDSITSYIKKNFYWPEMQYLTLKWSGKWHNIDISYSAINGYPDIKLLNGLHFIGIKPWQINNASIKNKYANYNDFQFWYSEFINLFDDYPKLNKIKKLQEIYKFAQEISLRDKRIS